jgi:hypothetical protein
MLISDQCVLYCLISGGCVTFLNFGGLPLGLADFTDGSAKASAFSLLSTEAFFKNKEV